MALSHSNVRCALFSADDIASGLSSRVLRCIFKVFTASDDDTYHGRSSVESSRLMISMTPCEHRPSCPGRNPANLIFPCHIACLIIAAMGIKPTGLLLAPSRPARKDSEALVLTIASIIRQRSHILNTVTRRARQDLHGYVAAY